MSVSAASCTACVIPTTPPCSEIPLPTAYNIQRRVLVSLDPLAQTTVHLVLSQAFSFSSSRVPCPIASAPSPQTHLISASDGTSSSSTQLLVRSTNQISFNRLMITTCIQCRERATVRPTLFCWSLPTSRKLEVVEPSVSHSLAPPQERWGRPGSRYHHS